MRTWLRRALMFIVFSMNDAGIQPRIGSRIPDNGTNQSHRLSVLRAPQYYAGHSVVVSSPQERVHDTVVRRLGAVLIVEEERIVGAELRVDPRVRVCES